MPLLVSIPLIIIGLAIQIVNKLSERYDKFFENIPYLKSIILWMSLGLIVVGGYGTINSLILTKKHEIFCSPSEITLIHQTNKDFILNVINNKDLALFDVNFSICVNNKNIVHSLINIKPAWEEKTPGLPVWIIRVNLSNGCSGIVFGSINPHSTKEFNISIKGEKIKTDSKIAFGVYDWSLEPSRFNIPTTREQIPKQFNEFFDDESNQSKKTRRAYFQKFKAPLSPYFPDEKESKLISVGSYRN